jgi:nucleotide-binding universal stress UspA family protein
MFIAAPPLPSPAFVTKVRRSRQALQSPVNSAEITGTILALSPVLESWVCGIGGSAVSDAIDFDSLLVPVDFSPASEAALMRALSLATPGKSMVIVLHVIEPTLIDFAVDHGWGSHEEVTAQMRKRAEEKLAEYGDRNTKEVEVVTLVSEGTPFLEILRKARDFAVDAIVIGKIGARGKIEKLLFGSTAEKVLRGSVYPVIVFPQDEVESENS